MFHVIEVQKLREQRLGGWILDLLPKSYNESNWVLIEGESLFIGEIVGLFPTKVLAERVKDALVAAECNTELERLVGVMFDIYTNIDKRLLPILESKLRPSRDMDASHL